jgi:hypothetical protein
MCLRGERRVRFAQIGSGCTPTGIFVLVPLLIAMPRIAGPAHPVDRSGCFLADVANERLRRHCFSPEALFSLAVLL